MSAAWLSEKEMEEAIKRAPPGVRPFLETRFQVGGENLAASSINHQMSVSFDACCRVANMWCHTSWVARKRGSCMRACDLGSRRLLS